MNWDKEWETFYQKSGGNQYPDPALIRFVAKNYYKVKPRSDVKILDLGCGTGANLWYLAKEGFTAYGIDGSISGIRRAQEKLDRENAKADIQLGDFIHLPYDNEFFDAVIDVASIQHNDDDAINKIIAEIHRVLRKGGKYFGMLIESDENLSDNRFFTYYFDKKAVKANFSQFKSTIIDYMQYSENNERNSIRFLLVESIKS